MADILSQRFGFKRVSSSSHLRTVAQARGLTDTRETLQRLGDLLDEKSDFAWLVNDVAAVQVAREPEQLCWFVDAVRKAAQVQHFREKFPHVLHVHFTAPEKVLRSRFFSRAREGDEAHTEGAYERCIAHPNERSARALEQIANLIIDLSLSGPDEAAEAIQAYQGGL